MLADHPRGKYSSIQGRAALCTGDAPARTLAGCDTWLSMEVHTPLSTGDRQPRGVTACTPGAVGISKTTLILSNARVMQPGGRPNGSH